MSLFGGPRAIWVEPAGDEIADGVEALLEAPASESPVVAIAGALRKTSALLKLAEAPSAALAHCSYMPEGPRRRADGRRRRRARYGLRVSSGRRGAGRGGVRQRPGDRRARSWRSSRSTSMRRPSRPRSSTMTRSTRSAPMRPRATSCGLPIWRWSGGWPSLLDELARLPPAAPRRSRWSARSSGGC